MCYVSREAWHVYVEYIGICKQESESAIVEE